MAASWREKLGFAPLVPRTVGEGRRVYAVGDVHGCVAQLRTLKAMIATDNAGLPAAHVTLVYVGDYVDRGPDSRRVVDEVLSPPPGVHETVRLKGNHEDILQQFIADPVLAEDWKHLGGLDTLRSYGVDTTGLDRWIEPEAARDALLAAMPDAHKQFFRELVTSFRLGDYFFCHAGVRPGVALEMQHERDLLWIRDAFLTSKTDFGAVVVHGHTPGPDPELRGNRINLDTGCCFTGRLTAAVLDGDRPVRLLATEGRNA
jgi:serine/threonine protein phosphatase 1